MENYCTACLVTHWRPTGRRCPRVSRTMATNCTSAPVAATETVTTHVSRSPVVASTQADRPVASTSHQASPVRKDDLILAELRQLSARLTSVEQEIATTSRTSTPRRKKAKTVRRNQIQPGSGVPLDGQVSLEEDSFVSNLDSFRLPSAVIQGPVATVSSASSLFTQSTVVTTAAGSPVSTVRPITATTMASCHSSHYTQHRPLLSAQTLPQPGRPVDTTAHAVRSPQSTLGLASPQLAPGSLAPGCLTRPSPSGLQSRPGGDVHNDPVSATCTCQTQRHHSGQVQPTLQQLQPVSHLGANAGWAQGTAPTAHVQDDPVLVPSLNALRTTAVDQDLVQRRLDQLHQQALPQQPGNILAFQNQHSQAQKGSGQKTKGKKEKIDIVWPQDCAYVGHLRAKLTYDQLNQSQFTLGYLRALQEETDTLTRANMLEHLTELYQDICDIGWQQAKGAQFVIYSKMEDGILTWADLDKLEKIRKTYIRAGTVSTHSDFNSNYRKTKKSSIPCRDYNEGRCTKQQDHDIGVITHRHICAFCLYSNNKQYNHPESLCMKKKAKNGQAHHP